MDTIYFMTVENPYCHDGDEWCGIYTDIQKLKEDYYKAKAALTRENGYMPGSFEIAVYAFEPNVLSFPSELDSCAYERITIDSEEE